MISDNPNVAAILEFIERYRLILILAALLLLVGLGFMVQYGAKAQVAVPTLTPSPASIVVDVQGAVAVPGVRELPEGSLIRDALESAGGLTAEADAEAFAKQANQAERLKDHQKIYVPRAGEVGNSSGGTSGELINLNAATKEELDSLPGIGPATAQKIIDYRESNGPFSSADELANISGIGDAKLEKLRSLVTV